MAVFLQRLFFSLLLSFGSGAIAHNLEDNPCHAEEIEEIKAAIADYLSKQDVFRFTKVTILFPQCVSVFASAVLHPLDPDMDDLMIYLREADNTWEVLGMGSHFEMDFLQKLPKELREPD